MKDVFTELAIENGLFFLGSNDLGKDHDFPKFRQWLDEGRHAGMAFLERNIEIRSDPRKLLEGARTIRLFGLRYQLSPSAPIPEVAGYAKMRDYHRVFRSKLEQVWHNAAQLQVELSEYRFRVVVDSAPMLERSQARQAGKVFIGKNTCAIHPEIGSAFLIGALISTDRLSDVVADDALESGKNSKIKGCGSCRRCQVHCPTGALDRDYQIDARKCLSYWTIEHRGPIPVEYWKYLKTFYFGCDICQNVCPFNRRVRAQQLPLSIDSADVRKFPSLTEVTLMNQSQYEIYFGGTPMTRAKIDGLKRNALIALIVTNDPSLPQVLEKLSNETFEVIHQTVKQIEEWRAFCQIKR